MRMLAGFVLAVSLVAAPAKSDLELQASLPHYATVGTVSLLSFRVINHSPPTVKRAIVTLRVSSVARFTKPYPAGCSGTATSLTCVVGPVPKASPCGAGRNVALTSVAPGRLVARLHVTSPNDPNPKNDSASATATVHAPAT